MNEYIVRYPLHTFVQYRIEADSEKEAEKLADQKQVDYVQVMNNLIKDGAVEVWKA